MPRTSSHFWWLPTTLSVVLSTLGILALAKHAFVTWSLSAPLELVMAAYNAMTQLVFGWAHPYLQAALTWVGSFIDWRPTLYPHWRDVFVVTSVIGIGAGRAKRDLTRFTDTGDGTTVTYIEGDLSRIAARNAYVFVPLVFYWSAVNALVAGLLPLQSSDLVVQILIACSPGLGLSIVALSSLDWRFLLIGVLFAAVVGVPAALATWGLSLLFGHVGGLGLAGIASMVVLLGLHLVFSGRVVDFRGHKSIRDVFAFTWGLTILGGFVGAAFVAAVDAGLKLLGA